MDHAKYWISLGTSPEITLPLLEEVRGRLAETPLSLKDLYDCTRPELKSEFGFSDPLLRCIEESRGRLEDLEDTCAALLENRITTIPWFSAGYPERLRTIMGTHTPPFLYTAGNSELLNRRGAAILGEGDISPKGEIIAWQGARELALHRLTVISGLARGAGQIAHRSALENGGTTIAVVPSGIFTFKIPPLMEELFDPERICIASTFFPTDTPDVNRALERNRIICALARAVYVVEAPDEGGVIEAARYCSTAGVPLYTTEYQEYPENSRGNRTILTELGGSPVRKKKGLDTIVPNMDRIIAHGKFDA
jgi:DNA processing protein